MSGEILPPVEPGEENLHTALAEMDVSRGELIAELRIYHEKPTEKVKARIASKAGVLCEDFAESVNCIFKDGRYKHLEMVQSIISLHSEEDAKRVEALNSILGRNLIKPDTFPLIEDVIDDSYTEPKPGEIDYESWGEGELESFKGTMECDLNKFLGYVDRLHEGSTESNFANIKNTVLKRTAEAATLAGAIAVGLIVAKRFEK